MIYHEHIHDVCNVGAEVGNVAEATLKYNWNICRPPCSGSMPRAPRILLVRVCDARSSTLRCGGRDMGLEIQVQDTAVRTAIDQTALCKSPSPPGLPCSQFATTQLESSLSIWSITHERIHDICNVDAGLVRDAGVRTAIEQTALQITITTTTSNEFCKPPSPPALPFL